MTLNVPITPELEARLRETAGKDLANFVLDAIKEKLATAEPTNGQGAPAGNSAQRRITELRHWVASHGSLPYEADDSRESIYEGRGE